MSRAVAGGLALLALGLSVAIQGALLGLPLLTMHIYDGVLLSRNADTLAALAIAYVIAMLLGGVLRWQRAALFAALAERVSRGLQLRALSAALRGAIAGDRVRGLTALSDVAELRRLLGGNTASELCDLVAMPAALFVLWLLHPLYGVVGLGGCLALAVLGAVTDRATRGLVREAGASQVRCTSDLAGRLRQRDVVEGLGMLPAVLQRWQRQHGRALEAQDAALRRARALGGLAGFAGQVTQVAIVAVGAWLVVTQSASPGSILAASLLIGMATAPGARLVASWRDWAFGLAAWRRVRALLAAFSPQPEAAVASWGAGLAVAAPPGLVLRGVGCARPDGARWLVRDLDLHVVSGEVLAVVGPNGVGKTTLLRAILGVQPPSEGEVLLDGSDTARCGAATAVGYLPQGRQLLEGSVLENIGRFGGNAPDAAVAAARAVGAHAMIGRLAEGYGAAAGPSGGLSGGQQQQVALARALCGAPRLLVLDEPEAGLDAAGLAALRGAVAAAAAAGAIVVLVTHQPEGWEGVVDRRLALSLDGTWRALAAEAAEELAA